jgi:hypothetical protein
VTVEAATTPFTGALPFWRWTGAVDDLVDGFAALDAEHEPGGDGPVGVLVELDRYDAAVELPGTGLRFAGYLPDGRQLRLRYFDGALIAEGHPDRPRSFPPRDEWRTMYPLDPAYSVHEFVVDNDDAVGQVLDLWEQSGAVPRSEARRRLHEVHLVAIERASTAIVAVFSAYLARSRQLRADLWAGRTLVTADHRRSSLGSHLTVHGYELLAATHGRGPDRRGDGLQLEVDHPAVRATFPQAEWPFIPVSLVAVKPNGTTVYAGFFDGVDAPEPPRPR